MRKSSGRSNHRRPPRATAPNLRWVPDTRGELTKTSNLGRGAGAKPRSVGQTLKANARRPLCHQFVRIIALMTACIMRKMRSWSSEATSSRSVRKDSDSSSTLAKRCGPASTPSSKAVGSNFASTIPTRSLARFGLARKARAMYVCEKGLPSCRRYRAIQRSIATWDHDSPASVTNPEKVSDSHSPFHDAANASVKRRRPATFHSSPGVCRPRSNSHTSRPRNMMRCGCSSII